MVDTSKITAIPQSTETLMTFRIGDLKLLDTMQLMGTSLEELVRNLKTKKEDKFELFHNMKNVQQGRVRTHLPEGVYPYEYIDGNEVEE